MRKTAAFTIALLFLMSPFVVQAEHNGFEDSDIDSATALDTDEDGHFDAYQIRFGSAVDSARVHANEFFVSHEFNDTWVAGIDVTAIGGEDRDYIVEFPERFTPDTATLPDLEYRQNGRDPVTPTLADGMKPVALSVYAATDSTDTAVVQFSEGINYEEDGTGCTSLLQELEEHITVTGGTIDSVDFTNGDPSLTITLESDWEVGDNVAFASEVDEPTCDTTLSDDEGNLIVDGTDSDFHDPVIEEVRGIHGSDQVQVRFSTPVRNSNGNAVGPANLDVVDDNPVRNVGDVVSCLDCFVLQLTMSGNPNGELDHDHLGSAKIDVDGSDVHATDGEAYGSTAVAITDDADPTILTVSGVQGDAGIKGVVTEVWISFSEPINTTGDINNSVDDWSVTGWDGIASVVGQVSDPPDNPDSGRWTQIKLVRAGPPAAAQENSSAPLVGLDYDSSDITDRSGNPLETFTGFGVQDEVSPVLIEAVTEDSDGDGLLDGYNLTFSEPIDDATFDCSDWTVSGHTVEDTDCFTLWDKEDQRHKGTLAFSEGNSFDTGEMPRLQAALGAVTDFAGNNLRSADTQDDDLDPTDGALPVFVEAVGTIGSQSVILRFSEAVNGVQDDDFDYDNENSGGATGLSSVDHDDGDATATMTVTGSVIEDDFDTDTVTFDGTATAANNGTHEVDEVTLFLTGSDERFDVVSITTVDGGDDSDLNGFIDHLNITFDSPIKDSRFDHTKWDVAGYTVLGNYTDGTPNDRYMHLQLEEDSESEGDTGATPNVQYSDGGLLNESNVALADIDMDAVDGAAPYPMTANTGVGSVVIDFTFSEGVKSTLTDGEDIEAPSIKLVPGGAPERNITSTTHTACQSLVQVVLDHPVHVDMMGNDTLEARTSVVGCEEGGALAASNDPIFLEDGKAPTIDRYETVGDGNGDVVSIRVVFDEAVDDDTIEDPNPWTIDLSATGGSSNAAPDDIITGEGENDTIIFLVLADDDVQDDTGIKPQVTYDADSGDERIADLQGNELPDTATKTAEDTAKPILLSAKTRDQNRNGKIDRYELTYSEDMDDSSFKVNEWDVVQYSEPSDRTQKFPSTNDDEVVILVITEQAGATEYDTGNVPDIIYESAGGTTSAVDMNGNEAAAHPPADPISEADGEAEDGAAPRLVGINATVGSDTVTVTFSEEVEESDSGGALTASDDFNFEDGNNDGARHLDRVDPGADATTWELVFDAAVVEGDLDQDTIDPKDSIEDEHGNANNQGALTLAGESEDDDPPQRITTLSASVDGEDSIELTWTAPYEDSEDSSSGAVTRYEVRMYDNGTINEDNFNDLDNVTEVTEGVPIPATPDSTESMTIDGLEIGVTYHFAIQSFDDQDQFSEVSNSPSAEIEEPDETDPGEVADLAVDEGSIAADRVTLTWTAPADDAGDNDSGAVSDYDVRWVEEGTFGSSESAFSGATEASVTLLVGSTAGAIAGPGQTQTAIVTGLDRDTDYELRVRAIDEADNEGPISDMVAFTTATDETPPSGSLSFTSGTHGDPSTATTAVIAWSGLSDPESTINYHYVRDRSANTEVTSANTATTSSSVTLQGLDTGVHYLHVKGISAGGATDTFDFEFEVVEELSDDDMQAANDALEYSVSWDGEKNTISWTLPDDPPMQITGVQIYRADSPYTLVETIERGSADFGDGNYVDDADNATADSTYLLQLVFRGGQSVFSGQGSDVPDTQAFAGIQPTQDTDGGDGGDGGTGGEDEGVPTWVWIVLAVVGASILIVIIVAIVASSRRSRAEEEEELVTAEREDDGYVWPEEEGAAAAAASGEAPPDEPEHHLECPNCSHRFVAHGEKPLTTTCPNCGKKGTLN